MAAAGGARPGLAQALEESDVKPDHVCTVFAGVDAAAVAQARNHFTGYPPSSPCMAILKDGEVEWFLHRHQIEGAPPQAIAQALQQAFKEVC